MKPKQYWAMLTSSDQVRVKRYIRLFRISSEHMGICIKTPLVKDWIAPFPARNRKEARGIAEYIFETRELAK